MNGAEGPYRRAARPSQRDRLHPPASGEPPAFVAVLVVVGLVALAGDLASDTPLGTGSVVGLAMLALAVSTVDRTVP